MPDTPKGNRRHRVGRRGSGQSAHQMTTEDLLAALGRKDMSKFRNNITTVLRNRGVDPEVAQAN